MPGLRLTPSGADVEVHAPTAELVELCLFDDAQGERRIPLVPDGLGTHRTFVPELQAGHRYGFRTHGPWQPEEGLWHHPELLLVDPFARALSGRFVDHPSVGHYGKRSDTAPFVPRSVAVRPPARPRPGPGVPWEDTVIYETHVRGLTMRHPDVPPPLRGTFLGASAPAVIEHLHRIGVTAVEFLPVAHHVTEPFLQQRGLVNYWGYSTLAWFAPHGPYATADDGRQVEEFALMVDQFHAAGLEVIIDVVFNHTAEGDLSGPILSFKGLDNRGWYRLDGDSDYVDWTGTGNTINTGHALVREAILEALHWWAVDLGVDGFRFDLGVTLGRDGGFHFDPDHLAWITDDPDLAGVKLIAEPWDLGPHGYRLGGFPPGWSEWNAQYRDQIRDLWRGHYHTPTVRERLAGSSDIFGERSPHASLNFVTAHDGFTLADLVAYDHKHNHRNGEDNRDGHDDNRSWNSGAEGPTDDASIIETRRRRSSALLATLMISAGPPMIQGGDELGRTLEGNNNAYPLDEPNWYDWEREPLVEVLSRLADIRRRHPLLRARGALQVIRDDPPVLLAEDAQERLLLVMNPSSDDMRIELPPGNWELEFHSAGPREGTQTAAFEAGPWSLYVLRQLLT